MAAATNVICAKLHNYLEKIEEGDVLEVTFDNPSSKETIVQMVEAAGNEIIEDKTDAGKIVMRIEKG